MADETYNDRRVEVNHNGGATPPTECPHCERQTLVQIADKDSRYFECLSCRYKHTVTAPRSSSQCFVATTVYGDANHPSVVSLRRFRDGRLNTYFAGRVFVRIYYSIGPHLSNVVGRSDRLVKLVRGMLEYFVRRIDI